MGVPGILGKMRMAGVPEALGIPVVVRVTWVSDVLGVPRALGTMAGVPLSHHAYQTFTYSKSTIEILEKGPKYVKS